MTATDIDSFRVGKDKSLNLKSDEVYLTSTDKNYKQLKGIWIVNKKYKIKPIELSIPLNVAIDNITVIIPAIDDLYQIANFYKRTDFSGNVSSSEISLKYTWDVEEAPANYFKKFSEMLNKVEYENIKLTSRSDFSKAVYSLTGSFILLGLMIGTIFLTGTVLILYYKQLSEGFNDRENYQIMKKIGLSDQLIKRTTRSQLLWVFFIPLMVATIHTAVASPVLYRLTTLFEITSIPIPIFVKTFALIIGVCARILCYFQNYFNEILQNRTIIN